MLNLLKNMFSSAPEVNYAELVKNGAMIVDVVISKDQSIFLLMT
ncbi:MAG: hypothetical protein RLZZ333_1073 [Bacteroidota bacterium]